MTIFLWFMLLCSSSPIGFVCIFFWYLSVWHVQNSCLYVCCICVSLVRDTTRTWQLTFSIYDPKQGSHNFNSSLQYKYCFLISVPCMKPPVLRRYHGICVKGVQLKKNIHELNSMQCQSFQFNLNYPQKTLNYPKPRIKTIRVLLCSYTFTV